MEQRKIPNRSTEQENKSMQEQDEKLKVSVKHKKGARGKGRNYEGCNSRGDLGKVHYLGRKMTWSAWSVKWIFIGQNTCKCSLQKS